MSKRRRMAAIMGFLAATGVAGAHHALEYIGMESYNTADRGGKIFYLQYDYMVGDRDNPDLDRWELTPGLAYGITDRLMVDVHTHFAKFGIDYIEDDQRQEFEPHGPSPFIEAIAIAAQYRLTEGRLLDLAVIGDWELPLSRAEKILGADEHVYSGTMIVSHDFGVHANISANIKVELEGSETVWFWALGARRPLSADPHGIAAGIEIAGDFDGDEWSVLPGMYLPLGPNAILKTGLEFGRERNGENRWTDTLRSNISLMYLF